jgi:hypothetical protein
MEMNKNMLIVVSLVIVFTIYFIFVSNKKDISDSMVPVDNDQATTTAITGSVYVNTQNKMVDDNDVEWIRYSNEELGFEMAHPKNLTVNIGGMIGDGRKFRLDLVRGTTTEISIGFDEQTFAMIFPVKKAGEKLTYTEEGVINSIKFFTKKESSMLLMSQNDAEIYYIGSTTDIIWKVEGIKSLDIVLESYVNNELVKIGSIAKSVDPYKSKYSWTVGNIYNIQIGEKVVFKPTLSSYMIRIEDPATGKFVRSRVPFTII